MHISLHLSVENRTLVILEKIVIPFWRACHSNLPPAMTKIPWPSTSSIAVSVTTVLNLDHDNRCVVSSHRDLICISKWLMVLNIFSQTFARKLTLVSYSHLTGGGLKFRTIIITVLKCLGEF